ncbi:GspE/PulE family protein [Marinicellulosiphila megalodicopiae]|uniref:GspE/PulE family protein n=1 Tax=Marinicellulosiphila megalodicopiae TaxID=2724896 RepID=UPI003BAF75BB
MTQQKRIRIGDVLVDENIISNDQLMLALQEQKTSGHKIGRVLVDMGLVEEKQLLETLSKHLRLPFIELRHFQLDQKIIKQLPENNARRYRVLLLSKLNDQTMQLAMADPMDLMAIDEIQRIIGKTVSPVIVRESELLATLDIVYRKQDEIAEIATELEGELSDSDFDLNNLAEQTDVTEAPVVRLLQSIFDDAVQAKASDIHIEPDESSIRVRMRIDGVLQEQIMKEKRIASALVLRLKIMSNLDISEKRLPQDGRFNIRVHDKSMDVRLSTLPTQYGESVVMRLLDQSNALLTLEKLGMPEDIRKRYELLIERPHGLILVTGPTGSGKTTTLYASLNKLNSPHRKIITAEDPIEYRLSRINQVQVNSKIELSFASILRSALRQDPDIILVGEMRDQETINIGLRAALTGHMVLSTLHTNDAISSALRLADMGVEPFMVASALRGVVAQRLVKKVCINCKQPYTPTAQEKMWMGHLEKSFKKDISTSDKIQINDQLTDLDPTEMLTMDQSVEINNEILELDEPDVISHLEKENIDSVSNPITTQTQFQFYKGTGCYQCNNTGYSGRIGIYELLEFNDEMLTHLRNMDHNGFIRSANNHPYFISLSERALMYARTGETDLTEVFRISSDLEDRSNDEI